MLTGHVDLDGVMMHYAAAGPAGAPPVVLLHGWPDLWFTWERQMELLAAEGYAVLAPDQRGYGRTSKPPRVADYRIDSLVGDIIGLCGIFGLGRVHLIGHDWGGAVAWALAMAHPELLATLTVLNAPHPGVFVEELRRPGQLLRSWYMLAFQIPGLAEAVLGAGDAALQARLLARGAGIDDPAVIDRYRQQWRNPGAVRMPLHWYRAMARAAVRGGRGGPGEAGPLTVPTMILWGRRDPVLAVGMARASAQRCTDVRVHEIDAGHWPHLQAHREVDGMLLDFLGAHTPARP